MADEFALDRWLDENQASEIKAFLLQEILLNGPVVDQFLWELLEGFPIFALEQIMEKGINVNTIFERHMDTITNFLAQRDERQLTRRLTTRNANIILEALERVKRSHRVERRENFMRLSGYIREILEEDDTVNFGSAMYDALSSMNIFEPYNKRVHDVIYREILHKLLHILNNLNSSSQELNFILDDLKDIIQSLNSAGIVYPEDLINL